ncbi:MAG: primosomal protein N', partial [Atopobiaceae bacterium]|nr:primosomal protein N' [Atopobiaceae bacterium]
MDPARCKDIVSVLAVPAFDRVSARIAQWMSAEYAAPLSECLRLFLPPGPTVKTRRSADGPAWELVNAQAGPVDDRWVSITEEGASFTPRRDASRQRALLDALSEGPVRMSELSAMSTGMSQVVSTLEKRGVVHVEARRRVRGGATTTLSSAKAKRPARLTEGQQKALEAICSALDAGGGDVVLVDGVTGSGKTEVYLTAIERVLSEGKSAIVLVPEISLTPQTVGRFRSRFGDEVAILHSRLSVGERFDQWDMARTGAAHVVVGARSALFAPLPDVGLIVIDEEHEGSYKQGQSPRYHAREVAARMAQERSCALVLGSATPSLESLARARAGRYAGAAWHRVEMPERPGASELPKTRVVDMTLQFKGGNRSIFSTPLRDALLEMVERREKAVLLLNRRGFANFLMCRECGCVPTCPHCSTSLTFHERTHSLMCHTCGREWSLRSWNGRSSTCPKCGSPYLAAFGVGTQRVEDELALLLGDDAEIIRMDADTTKGKGDHQRLLERFDAAECAVLVGTQMIAKGLDFPEVTLVGVINADTTLKLPDFRAPERTYDLLEQVSGRAGRGDDPGRVIVQTYWADHPAIKAVETHDRSLFLESELADREDACYPPFTRLSNVIAWSKDARAAKETIDAFASALRERADGRDGWMVLGPADCVRSRVKDNTRYHLLLKTPTEAEVGAVLADCAKRINAPKGVSIAIDVDAYDLM